MSEKAAVAPPVRHAVLIRAGSGRIWTALTTKEGLEGWFCQSAEIRLRKGGQFTLRWKDWGPERYTGEAKARIELVARRKRYVYVWQSHPNHPKTRVDIRLEERGPITLVRLAETGFEDDVDAAMANAVGWGEALTLLKFYAEHGLRY